MPAIARHGDACGGGTIVATATKMTVNRDAHGNPRPVALGPAMVDGEEVLGDAVTSHGDSPHNSARLTGGSAKITCEGRPVILVGHPASCGHNVSSGSPNATASA